MTHIEKMRLQAALETTSGACTGLSPLAGPTQQASDSHCMLRQRERQGRSEETRVLQMDRSASIRSTQPPSAGNHSALWALYTVPVAWFTVTIRRTSPSPTTITSVPR